MVGENLHFVITKLNETSVCCQRILEVPFLHPVTCKVSSPPHNYISAFLFFFLAFILISTAIHVIQSSLLERLRLVFFTLLLRESQMDTDVSFNVIHSFFCLCCQKHLVAEISSYNELLNTQ